MRYICAFLTELDGLDEAINDRLEPAPRHYASRIDAARRERPDAF